MVGVCPLSGLARRRAALRSVTMSCGFTQVNGQTAEMTQPGKPPGRAASWTRPTGPARTAGAATRGHTATQAGIRGVCRSPGAEHVRSSARFAQLCAGATGIGERPFAKGRPLGPGHLLTLSSAEPTLARVKQGAAPGDPDMTTKLQVVPARRRRVVRPVRGKAVQIIAARGKQVVDTCCSKGDDRSGLMSGDHLQATIKGICPAKGDALTPNRRCPILLPEEEGASARCV